MLTLSRHIEYTSPVGSTFPLVRDRGVEYSASGLKKVRLLDQMRLALRSRHYSRRIERTYCQWVKRYVHFHHLRHPAEMGEAEIRLSRHYCSSTAMS